MHRASILCFVALLFVPNGAWAQGEPLGPEFKITGGDFLYEERRPAVASDSVGNFVVVWNKEYLYSDVLGQRYANTGAPWVARFT